MDQIYGLKYITVKDEYCFLSCNCVILGTNKGGQINFSVI
jgi:hypothetical protein